MPSIRSFGQYPPTGRPDPAPFVFPPESVAWDVATTITDDTDIRTDGTLFAAYNISDTAQAVTINGVQFEAFSVPTLTTSITVANFTLQETSGSYHASSGGGSVSAPFASLSEPYQILLSSAISHAPVNTIRLTMSNLTIGQGYLFQWWANFSAAGVSNTTTATAGTSVTVTENVSQVVGGTGQFAVGYFTATHTSSTIDFNGSLDINGFQLRSIPEPSTWVLVVIGFLGWVALRKRVVL